MNNANQIRRAYALLKSEPAYKLAHAKWAGGIVTFEFASEDAAERYQKLATENGIEAEWNKSHWVTLP